MSKSSQNRRQFLKNTGKAGIALATAPILSSWNFSSNEFQQQALPYAYNALEPYVDAMTMEIHYTKHAATYTKNLNDAAAIEFKGENISLEEAMKKISQYSPKLRNNGGGHFNHSFFWNCLAAPSTMSRCSFNSR